MKVKELMKILKQYPEESDLFVLEVTKANGAGFMANIKGVYETINQDTNKTELYIQTDYNRQEVTK